MRGFAKRLWAWLLALLAAVLLGFAGWSLIDGEVTEKLHRITGGSQDYNYYAGGRNRATYTRADDPGDYWRIVGVQIFLGLLFALLAVAEFRNPMPRLPGKRGTGKRAALERHRKMLEGLLQRGKEVYRRRARAETFDPAVRAAMNEAVRAFGHRLGVAGLAWRDIPDARHPEHRALYVVFPTLVDLELSAKQAALIEPLVREALDRHGYPAEWLGRVSVHLTSTEILEPAATSDRAGDGKSRPAGRDPGR